MTRGGVGEGAMFYGQSSDHISWERFGYACWKAFAVGTVLGVVFTAGLLTYWLGYRANHPQTFTRDESVLTVFSPKDWDGLGPHTMVTGVDGFDFYTQSFFHTKPMEESRSLNGVVWVSVFVVMGSGIAAVLVLWVASIAGLRWRTTAAQERAPHTIQVQSEE